MTVKINGTNTAAAPAFTGADTDTGLQCGTNEVNLVTGGTAQLKIDSSGRVGVGSSAPYNVLTGKSLSIGNGVGAAEINFLSATDGYGSLYFGDGTSGNAKYRGYLEFVHTDESMRFGTAASEKMRIDSSGNVGIGTSSPTSYGNSQATLVIEDSTNPAICWSDTGQTRDWWAVANGSNLSFVYADGGGSGSASNVTAALSMANSGKVGIGTSDPGQHLTVKRTGGQTQVSLISDTDQSGAIYFGDTASTARGVIEYDHTGDFMRLYTSGSERVRIQSGGGISFNGDTASANALNDYEEGTFTPIWTTTGTNFSSVTYTNQDGKYTKIGNIVHVSLRLTSTASSGGSGNLLVGGLPFTVNDSAGSGGGSPSSYNINYDNSTINVATETRVNNNQFYLLSSSDGGGWTNVDYGGIMGNGVSELRVSFDYITNS